MTPPSVRNVLEPLVPIMKFLLSLAPILACFERSALTRLYGRLFFGGATGVSSNSRRCRPGETRMRIYTYATKRLSMRQPSALRRSILAALAFVPTAAAFGIGGTPLTAPAHAADVFVAPTGTDTADGSADKPVATLRRALDRVREIRAAEPARDTPIEVELADGRYELAQTVEIAGEDSGTERSPTVIRAVAGGRAVLSGGRTVTQWLPVTDEAVVARLDPAARGHVVQADLKALGIADYGVMSGGFALSGGPGLELFHDDVPMTVARYPNKGFIKITEVLGPTPDRRPRHDWLPRSTVSDRRPTGGALGHRTSRHGARLLVLGLGGTAAPIESIDARTSPSTSRSPFTAMAIAKDSGSTASICSARSTNAGRVVSRSRSGNRSTSGRRTAARPRASVVSVLGSLVTAKGASHVMLRGLTFEGGAGQRRATSWAAGLSPLRGCIFRNLGSWASPSRAAGALAIA